MANPHPQLHLENLNRKGWIGARGKGTRKRRGYSTGVPGTPEHMRAIARISADRRRAEKQNDYH